MYAIIRAGGHQEKVTAGDTITVDRLKEEVGGEVSFVPLMISTDDGTVVSERRTLEERAAVLGRVLEHVKGDKVDVFQYRQKTGYRRHIGHRQPLTLVEISEIRFGDAVARAEEAKAERAEAAEAAQKAKVEAAAAKVERKAAERAAPRGASKAGAKKAPAKKPAAKRPGAKKPAAKKAPPKKKEK